MTGRDANAAWEWGVVARVYTGLLLYSLDMQPVAREMLAAAGEIAERYPRFP
jgi:streptomycin 6-kinase